MDLCNKKTAKRISVWTLVFTVALVLTMTCFTISAQGKSFMDRTGDAISDVGNGVGNAVSDVGDALSDVGSGMGDAMSDMADGTDGAVKDSDGIIGNETETAAPEDEGMPGWLGIVIALAIVGAVILLIVILIPKKKDR